MARIHWLLAWSLVVCTYASFALYGLFDLDEGIYAAALREMQERGTWISITYRGAPFYEKPILMYWSGLLTLSVGLKDEMALRLGPVVATLITLWSTARFVRRRFGEPTALSALLIAALNPLMILVGRQFQPDAFLVCFLSLALFSWFEGVQGARFGIPFAGLWLGLAILAKGPVAILLFVPVALWSWAKAGVPSAVRAGSVGAFLFLMMGIVAVWLVAVWKVHGEAFFQEFILRQNVMRFLGGDLAHRAPFWAYVPVIVMNFLPFALFAGRAWSYRLDETGSFLWMWIATVFVLFTLAGTKLPHYLLPLVPPAGILLGKSFVEKRVLVPGYPSLCGLAISLFSFVVAREMPPWRTSFMLLGELGVLSASVGLFSLIFRKTSWAEALGVSAVLAMGIAWIVTPSYWETTHGDAFRVGQLLRRETLPVVEFRSSGMGAPFETAHPSIQWYAGRTTESVEWLDELARVQARAFILLIRIDKVNAAMVEKWSYLGLRVEREEMKGKFRLLWIKRVEINGL